MQVSYTWLLDYLEYNGTFQDFCDTLSLTGTKVEAGFEAYKEIQGVVVGEILSIEQHPNADRLKVCKAQVKEGEEPLQILTAATNVLVGQKVPVALVGATLADGLTIKKSKMRGEVSLGMFCSFEELGLGREDLPDAPEDGIYILDDAAPLGVDVMEYLGFRDHWIEFEITPNRPDCLSVEGIAREAAVSFDLPFTLPEYTFSSQSEALTEETLHLRVTDETACPRYQGWIIDDVTIGPSPSWLRQRLRSAGIRPINNLVDITNYVMLTTGNPLHAFDLSIIEGDEIIVRTAAEGEFFETLDGVKRKLKDSDLVIADEKKSLALAGIMGGAESEISEQTKKVFLEIANFEPERVRKTSSRLGLTSDSSQRFVRGIQRETVDRALQLALKLITDLNCGVPRKFGVNFAAKETAPCEIPFNAEKINQRLGLEIEESWMLELFAKLGFTIKADLGDRLLLVPYWRTDVTSQADLSEEVARFYGYNKIPARLFSGETKRAAKRTTKQIKVKKLREILMGVGAFEAMSSPFASANDFTDLGLEPKSEGALSIRNPLGQERAFMAQSLLPRHLEHLLLNQKEKPEELFFFELARSFKRKDEGLPEEIETLSLSSYAKKLSGSELFFKVKGVLEAIFSELRLEQLDFEAVVRPYLQEGQAAEIKHEGVTVGFLGRVHPTVLEKKEVKGPVVFAELNLTKLLAMEGTPFNFEAPSKFPGTERDLAVLCDKSVPHRLIKDMIEQTAGQHLVSCELFDRYEGANIPEQLKSLAYRLTYRSAVETLTDETVDKSFRRVLKKLADEGLEIRDH